MGCGGLLQCLVDYTTHRPNRSLCPEDELLSKIIFVFAGIKTTQSNRAFVDAYGPEVETAAFLKDIINMGAVIVGKTKMCAFASSEEATDQWIDFHAPFNPRADGYQSPSGSTTGGAASLAGYDWLDFSIGTDTTGSIRWPAAWNGLFALRATTNAVPLEGVYASCSEMDTLGLLARDLHDLHDLVVSSISKSAGDIKKFPKKILYSSDFFPHSNLSQQAMVDEYVSILEDFLGVKKTTFSIANRWLQCPPPEANGKNISEFLKKTAFYPFYFDGYHEFDKFREDYEKKFNKKVYVGPYMRWKWDQGAQVTIEHKEQALVELSIYRRWFNDTIMKGDPETASDAILILPCGSGDPKYRDSPNSSPVPVAGFSPNYIASLLSLPQIILPIGQLAFESRISGREEHLPIVGSMAGAKGSDIMLLKLAIAAFQKAGWATKVLTGRYALELGSGTRNAATAESSGKVHRQ